MRFYFHSSRHLFCRVLTMGMRRSPTLSVAVRSPCCCSDYFQCTEVWSRGATTPGTPLASSSRTDHFQVGVPRLPVSYRHSTIVPGRQHKSHGCRWNEAESASAFQFVNGGRCSSDTSQHDWGSRCSSRCCPRLEQPTVVCHVSVVTVDFQATFKNVLVRSVVLSAPRTVLLLPVFPYLPNTSFFSFFGMLRVLVVFGLNATLIFSLMMMMMMS